MQQADFPDLTLTDTVISQHPEHNARPSMRIPHHICFKCSDCHKHHAPARVGTGIMGSMHATAGIGPGLGCNTTQQVHSISNTPQESPLSQ